jgi:hypothetical protein
VSSSPRHHEFLLRDLDGTCTTQSPRSASSTPVRLVPKVMSTPAPAPSEKSPAQPTIDKDGLSQGQRWLIVVVGSLIVFAVTAFGLASVGKITGTDNDGDGRAKCSSACRRAVAPREAAEAPDPRVCTLIANDYFPGQVAKVCR